MHQSPEHQSYVNMQHGLNSSSKFKLINDKCTIYSTSQVESSKQFAIIILLQDLSGHGDLLEMQKKNQIHCFTLRCSLARNISHFMGKPSRLSQTPSGMAAG